jgi:hypothetical protein
MSNRAAIAVLLLLWGVALFGQDWGEFARHSGTRDDGLLIDLIGKVDLAEALDICAGIGMRSEAAVGPIIESIASDAFGPGRDRSEALLRVLLAALLDPSRPDPSLAARVSANAGALGDLLEGMADWKDPQLAGELVRIIPLIDGPSGPPALMAAGERIVASLQRGSGRLMPQEASLAMDFLTAVRETSSRDFLPSCALVARLSTDADLVKAARETAASIVGAGG